MKKLFTLAILFYLGIAMAQGENQPELWQTYRIKAKTGSIDAFEKAASKKTKMFNSSPEKAIFTYKVMDGKDQGMYERIVGFKSWDFYNNEESNQKEVDYWSNNVGQHIESSTGWTVWRRWVQYSHNWRPENPPAKHMSYLIRIVKPGATRDFLNLHQRQIEVYKKYGYRGIKGLFQVASGGNTQQFLIVNPFDKFGENPGFEKSEKSFADLYNEMFGWGSWMADLSKYNESLVDWGRAQERLTIVKGMTSQF